MRTAIVATLWLCACSHFESAAIDPEHGAAQLEARRLDAPELRAFLGEHMDHRLATGTLALWNLSSLTLAALHLSPALVRARARSDIALAGVLKAGARPNPKLSLLPEYVANAGSSTSPWLMVLRPDWRIETAGKRGYRVARATLEAEAARLGVSEEAWRVRGAVRAGVVTLAGVRARVRNLEKILETQHQLVHLFEQRLELGAISRTELQRLRLAELATQLTLAAVAREHLEATAQLAAALSVPALALKGIGIDFPLDPESGSTLSEADLPEARRRALLERADVRAALARYDASQINLQLELARQYPDLNLGGGYEFDQGENKWALGLTLELPILNQHQGSIAEAEARRREAAGAFEAVQTRVIALVDAAIASERGARKELQTADSLVAEQRERLRRIQTALTAGAADRVAQRSAQLALERAEGVRIGVRTRLQRALGRIEAATQPRLEVFAVLESASDPAISRAQK